MATQFASSSARKALTEAGLDSLEGVLGAGSPVDGNPGYRGGRHAGRDVARERIELDGEAVTVYIKRQHHRLRKIPRLIELRTGVAGLSHPEREWRGLWYVARLGISAAQPLALYTDDRQKGRAAVITRALPVERTLHDLLDMPGAVSDDDVVRLAGAIAEVARRLFSAGLAWRSMKAKHFYPEWQEDRLRTWLLDCEGVHGRALTRDRVRSMRVFRQSIEHLEHGSRLAELVEHEINERR